MKNLIAITSTCILATSCTAYSPDEDRPPSGFYKTQGEKSLQEYIKKTGDSPGGCLDKLDFNTGNAGLVPCDARSKEGNPIPLACEWDEATGCTLRNLD